jgi:hypothetical protein
VSRRRFAGRRIVLQLFVTAALLGVVLAFGADGAAARTPCDEGGCYVLPGSAYWINSTTYPSVPCAGCILKIVDNGNGNITYYSITSHGFFSPAPYLYFGVEYHLYLLYAYQHNGVACGYTDSYPNPFIYKVPPGFANSPPPVSIYLFGDSDNVGCPAYPEGGGP